MKWVKEGPISLRRKYDWMVMHAQLPLAENIEGERYRIYFSGRNRQNMSQIGYLEININRPQDILHVTEKPVIRFGPLGTFDDSGVFPSWIVNHGKRKLMYYTGWMQGKRVPYYASIGLAISLDGSTYSKHSCAAILDRNNVDPYMTHSPCVMIENGKWRMWYCSGLGWEVENNKSKAYYHIRYAESEDGINWKRNGTVCLDFYSENEFAISRPSVMRENGIYKMWYCYSRGSYRIGYAESHDGIKWERKDHEVGIDISGTGWDSETIVYPFVFEHKGNKFLLYNGNSYGKEGFGYAQLHTND